MKHFIQSLLVTFLSCCSANSDLYLQRKIIEISSSINLKIEERKVDLKKCGIGVYAGPAFLYSNYNDIIKYIRYERSDYTEFIHEYYYDRKLGLILILAYWFDLEVDRNLAIEWKLFFKNGSSFYEERVNAVSSQRFYAEHFPREYVIFDPKKDFEKVCSL